MASRENTRGATGCAAGSKLGRCRSVLAVGTVSVSVSTHNPFIVLGLKAEGCEVVKSGA